ncbi:hypothetical protein DIPPA_21727 [Diplonema papillatum]|nr:hypothetical protein DIPPA_21727 [Diplonema papillatum]
MADTDSVKAMSYVSSSSTDADRRARRKKRRRREKKEKEEQKEKQAKKAKKAKKEKGASARLSEDLRRLVRKDDGRALRRSLAGESGGDACLVRYPPAEDSLLHLVCRTGAYRCAVALFEPSVSAERQRPWRALLPAENSEGATPVELAHAGRFCLLAHFLLRQAESTEGPPAGEVDWADLARVRGVSAARYAEVFRRKIASDEADLSPEKEPLRRRRSPPGDSKFPGSQANGTSDADPARRRRSSPGDAETPDSQANAGPGKQHRTTPTPSPPRGDADDCDWCAGEEEAAWAAFESGGQAAGGSPVSSGEDGCFPDKKTRWEKTRQRYYAAFGRGEAKKPAAKRPKKREKRPAASRPATEEELAARNDRAYAAFAREPPRCVTSDNFPWPTLCRGRFPVPAGAQRKQHVRHLLSQWHPDKVTQRFASLIHPEHAARILERVTGLAQVLNGMLDG